jgi:5-methylcytosine-specific restriction endonuclease McrA
LNLEECLEEVLEVFLKKNDPLLSPTQSHERVRLRAGRKPVVRRIPVATKRKIHQKEGGRCSYRGADGRLCGAESFLQIHHLRPWAQGGTHAVENLQILCSAHHRWLHD